MVAAQPIFMQGASTTSFEPLPLCIQFMKEIVTLSHNTLFQRKWYLLIFQLFTYIERTITLIAHKHNIK